MTVLSGVKISQVNSTQEVNGEAFTIIAFEGRNYKVTLSQILDMVERPTKDSIGLGNVDNTSDVNKPVSSATAQALDEILQHFSNVDNTSDLNKPVSTATAQVIQAILDRYSNVDNTSDLNKPIASAVAQALQSILDRYSNVDNTHDVDKPISNAVAQALDEILQRYSNVDNTHDSDKPISTLVADALQAILDRISNVDNTHDTDKPLSTLSVQAFDSITQALGSKQDSLGFTPENSANKGVANGYAALDSNSLIPLENLPSYVDDVIEVETLPLVGESGKIYIVPSTNKQWRWAQTVWVDISQQPQTTDTVTEAAGTDNKYLTAERSRNLLMIDVKTVIADYVVQAVDYTGTLIRVISDVASTVYLPSDDVDIPVGACVLIGKSGTGNVHIVPQTGATVNTSTGYFISKNFAKITAIKVAANTWDLEGNLSEI